MNIIYADNAATTPLSKAALKAMMPFMTDEFGNPSSQYPLAWKSKDAITQARDTIKNLCGCKGYHVIFTSGGTEADNMVLRTTAYKTVNQSRNQIIVSSFEHPAILNTCKFLESLGVSVTYLPVNHNGFVEPDTLRQFISDKTALVSIMMANNEIGTIQPIKELSKIVHDYGAIFHTDAVQAIGHIPVDIVKMNVDLLSLSGHKFGGPKGVGALISNNTNIPFIYGGGQENGLRSGTENVAGIVGMAAAMKESLKHAGCSVSVIKLRNQLIEKLMQIEGVSLNGSLNCRLPGNINLSIDGVEGESIVLYAAQHDICISAGSACHSGSLEGSHVLKAIGSPHKGSIRISLSRENSESDINQIYTVISEAVNTLRI